MSPWYQPLLFGLLAAFSLVGVALWVIIATNSAGPGWLFTAVWTVGMGHLGRWYLWKTVYELQLDGSVLYWKTPLRSGAVALSDIRVLRPMRGSLNSQLIRLADGTALMVFMGKGFLPFIDDLTRQSPELPVRTRPFFSQLLENWPLQGKGGYERRD